MTTVAPPPPTKTATATSDQPQILPTLTTTLFALVILEVITGIALYYYPKSSLPLIRQYIAEGNNPDQPGRLVQWMFSRTLFYTWRVPGKWYDIGSHETLAEADRIFSQSR